MHVILAGAGIGGISTALCCLRRGFKVTLLEQASALREVGAGIQISSNGSAVLRKLGLLDEADRIGVRSLSFRMLGFEDGEQIADMPLGPIAAERYGERFYQFHRADFLGILFSALPSGVLRLDSRLDSFRQDSEGVTAVLKSGEEIRGDVLVGADGVHSTIRPQLVGDGPTAFSGKLVWRALIPSHRIRDLRFDERFYGWAGPNRMVWAYWVRSGALFNFGGVVPSGEVRRESWDETGNIQEMRDSLKGANPQLDKLVAAVDRAFVTGLYDRDPLSSWTSGRLTLLGDSAHAMLPYLAQGACQALEDGYVLAACLARHGTQGVPDALAEYELRRRPRTTKVQSSARAAHIFWTEADKVQISARNGRMRGLAQVDPLTATIWGWLYSYNLIAAADSEIVPDKRGKWREFPDDSPMQQKAWKMWHGLFSPDEEARGLSGLREGYERFFAQFAPLPGTVSAIKLNPSDALWVVPKDMEGKRIILHLHGGGFSFGSANCSIEYVDRLTRALNARGFVPNYRLAPEYPFPAGLEDCFAAYRHLLSQGHESNDIFVSAESAGCALAVSVAMMARDHGLPQPAGLILLSPLVDCSLKSESISRLNGCDPVIDRDILTYMMTGYFQSSSPEDPQVSPIFGDFLGMSPMLIQAAESEVLVDDAKRLAAAAAAAKVNVTLELYPERLHIFSIYPFLESSRKALASAAAFVKSCAPNRVDQVSSA